MTFHAYDPCPVQERLFAVFAEDADEVVAAMARWLGRAEVDDLPTVAQARRDAIALSRWLALNKGDQQAQLAAAEIERRLERRIAELIREGQAQGRVRGVGQSQGPHASTIPWHPQDFIPRKSLSGARGDGIYVLLSVPFEAFEQALEAGRERGNLSRANVCRLVRGAIGGPASERIDEIRRLAAEGHTARQIGDRLGVSEDRVRRLARSNDIVLVDAAIGPRRRIDPNRVVGELVPALEGLAMTATWVDIAELDAEQVPGWARSMRSSLRKINGLAREMAR